ncbi:hypothetical protein CFP56_011916 [Quercus suber]|uniref:Uncharacterized protein n=1 Tax=Quercus suber TaxID=58331 RepID=A0AAW0KY22_QUESU
MISSRVYYLPTIKSLKLSSAQQLLMPQIIWFQTFNYETTNAGIKLELYKRWGWSKDVALLAFKRRPHCMLLSEEKITEAMDFLVNKMGCPSAVIARNPIIILFNLEKRIIPRCLVIQSLLAEGLL